jgi:PilZ domain-containing protein
VAQNRKTDRKPSYLGGRISYNQDMWSEDCIVRNASKTGAKLSVADPRTLPDQFKLAIPSRGETFRARIKWRADNQIGVEFENDELAPVIELASARRLRAKAEAFAAGRDTNKKLH